MLAERHVAFTVKLWVVLGTAMILMFLEVALST
jgi:hypothetical protein